MHALSSSPPSRPKGILKKPSGLDLHTRPRSFSSASKKSAVVRSTPPSTALFTKSTAKKPGERYCSPRSTTCTMMSFGGSKSRWNHSTAPPCLDLTTRNGYGVSNNIWNYGVMLGCCTTKLAI
ncbi:hypothetical protein F4802DRAFT_244279 [Xylaria palmicola]|nr:hypothetical protein F4802DRAFT_244279 [Xylaria palmicola]